MARRGGGVRVFFKKVTRGTIAPRPYLRPGLQTGSQSLRRAVQTVLATAQSVTAAQLRKKLALAARTGGLATLQAAKRKAPADKGTLRNNISLTQIGQFEYSVGTNLIQGIIMEKGSKGGQTIRPRRARALSFVWSNPPSPIRRAFGRRGRRRGRRR